MSSVLLVNANSLQIPLADKSVHCVVTSPPYWGLRDYGIEGQLGLEQTLEGYVESMVQVFREVWRVLRDDGTLWLNLGDTYASGMRSAYDDDRHKYQTARAHDKRPPTPNGIKPKDLIGIPWRVAFALQADGWYLRSDIIWAKPNPMPESVTDRPTKAHEYIFLLTKSQRYFYDADAVREDYIQEMGGRVIGRGVHSYNIARGGDLSNIGGYPQTHSGRNRRTVWNIATAPYSGAHFATYPPALVEPCIKAGTSQAGCCSVCGKPWERVVTGERMKEGDSPRYSGCSMRNDANDGRYKTIRTTTGFRPTCTCDAPPRPCIVFDPFAGSGTTLQVARQLGRRSVGLDLSYTYLHDQARTRLELDRLDAWVNGMTVELTNLGPLFERAG